MHRLVKETYSYVRYSIPWQVPNHMQPVFRETRLSEGVFYAKVTIKYKEMHKTRYPAATGPQRSAVEFQQRSIISNSDHQPFTLLRVGRRNIAERTDSDPKTRPTTTIEKYWKIVCGAVHTIINICARENHKVCLSPKNACLHSALCPCVVNRKFS